METAIAEVIIAILGLIAAAIGGLVAKYAVPWLRERRLDSFAAKLVALAWSLFEDGQGKEKFDYVFEQLDARFGHWCDIELIRAAVQEAYVDFCNKRGVTPSRGDTGASVEVENGKGE